MSYRAWVELFRRVLVQLGAGQEAHQPHARQRAQHAGLLQLDPELGQALGYWQDVPKPSAEIRDNALAAARVSFPMSRLLVYITARAQLVSLALLFQMIGEFVAGSPPPQNGLLQVTLFMTVATETGPTLPIHTGGSGRHLEPCACLWTQVLYHMVSSRRVK